MYDVTEVLAACILVAEHKSKKISNKVWLEPQDSENEHYWHTREKVFELALQRKIHFGEVLSRVNLLKYKDHGYMKEVSSSLWDEVAHPDFIIQEVLGS